MFVHGLGDRLVIATAPFLHLLPIMLPRPLVFVNVVTLRAISVQCSHAIANCVPLCQPSLLVCICPWSSKYIPGDTVIVVLAAWDGAGRVRGKIVNVTVTDCRATVGFVGGKLVSTLP
jgi:hypothetical protein